MDFTLISSTARELGLSIPSVPPSAYSYDPVVTHGELAFVSGQIPKVEEGIAYEGAVGNDLTVEEAFQAAGICSLNVIGQAEAHLGFRHLSRLLKLTVYVASDETFLDQPAVAEGASLMMRKLLGENGRHARTAIGVPRLPKNAPVEVDAIFGLA